MLRPSLHPRCPASRVVVQWAGLCGCPLSPPGQAPLLQEASLTACGFCATSLDLCVHLLMMAVKAFVNVHQQHGESAVPDAGVRGVLTGPQQGVG